MNYARLLTLMLISLLQVSGIQSFKGTLTMQQVGPTQIRAEIDCLLMPNELLLHNSLQFSLTLPSARITNWYTVKDPQTYFDSKSKRSETVYNESVRFILTIESSEELPPETLIHMQYATTLSPELHNISFPLSVSGHVVSQESDQEANVEAPVDNVDTIHTLSSITEQLSRLSSFITTWIQDKELPLIMKFVLAFIIGLMMSLTPCIYPMIPITMGILQANKAHSLLRGFLLASAYTAGLSITFAILGMLAAFGGSQFGSLMSNPVVIVPIMLFFGYLGFSMLGCYEMYIPRFMQSRHGHQKNGSFLSAFSFGMINGTVASPCLSPGLALILGIVSGLGNPLLGFCLLFVFGVGSSFPLLIIGTFSTSLHVLPRAGKWMIEFKKVFGFLLLAMCLYYGKVFMPEWIFSSLLGLYGIAVASYYMYYGVTYKSLIAQLVAIGLCCAAAGVLSKSYDATRQRIINNQQSALFPWRVDSYNLLRQHAMSQKKLLLLDFTADWCSLCKKLEKEFFGKIRIVEELPSYVIPLKVDCTQNNFPESDALRKKFKIIGFPTILLIDPLHETVIKRWTAELNEADPEDIIAKITLILRDLQE